MGQQTNKSENSWEKKSDKHYTYTHKIVHVRLHLALARAQTLQLAGISSLQHASRLAGGELAQTSLGRLAQALLALALPGMTCEKKMKGRRTG
jgi:hypothetical protein